MVTKVYLCPTCKSWWYHHEDAVECCCNTIAEGWECDECGTEYADKGEAQKCEDEGIKSAEHSDI